MKSPEPNKTVDKMSQANEESSYRLKITSQNENEDVAQIISQDDHHNETTNIIQDHNDDASDLNNGSDVTLIDENPRSTDGSLLSGPDDTPSIQGSILSSPSSSVVPTGAITRSDTSLPGSGFLSQSFRPFDRRFTSRISSTLSIPTSKPASPAQFHGHTRNTSMTSQFTFDQLGNDSQSAPWEVVRWTKLNRLTGQAFSEIGKRNFGTPTFLAVASSIFIGTSKGLILMFDYSQNLKIIIGAGTQALECGAVTSLAVSADYSTVASGHASGFIFTWETSKASRPFMSIPPLHHVAGMPRKSDGHMPNVSVTHLGFLGTRRTALVSADNRGMAFSHLATRGTGAFGRTVKTTRILGRYPDALMADPSKPLKPSTVLAFASLPLGNVERLTDTMGLTAMLTPYLLVIISTTPVAQTQYKAPRPKDIKPHSTMSGCISWFPAGRLRTPNLATGSDISKAKLVYCWSNILTILEVNEIPSDSANKPPMLELKSRNRWRCEEAIVAVQWLSRSVITVLTITQRLVILEDRTMRVTDEFDLMSKYIYHADLFSNQLQALVDRLDPEEVAIGESMHGVVADAFYMSLKTFKGRLFLMGFEELSIGALSNWHDRLVALMQHGDYVASLQLAISYYIGESDILTVGLPDDAEIRHPMVAPRIVELITESLEHIATKRKKHRGSVPVTVLKDFVESVFETCQKIGRTDFLFESVYEWYEDQRYTALFLETLESYILQDTIIIVPPVVVKQLVYHYVSKGLETRLEEMICHLETSTLDLDQIIFLCKQHGLYDALIYVWNRGIGDYITPMVDLLSLLVTSSLGETSLAAGSGMADGLYGINAVKIFPYLSYILTGRVYPMGDLLGGEDGTKAKSELYWFLFSGNTVEWPQGSGRRFITHPDRDIEPSFPYLRHILRFDAPSLLSALNEAFEDSFLNEATEKHVDRTGHNATLEAQAFGLTVDRQYVVSILLEIMTQAEFPPSDTIYLDMFIARNMAKFPQYLIFPGSILSRVLSGLCHYPGPDLAEDAQLSAEYLLSIYQPPDMDTVIPMLYEAKFYRILKRIFLSSRNYSSLVKVSLEDAEDKLAIFKALKQAIEPGIRYTSKQCENIISPIMHYTKDLLSLEPRLAADSFRCLEVNVHQEILNSSTDPETQFWYLHELFEPELTDFGNKPSVFLKYPVMLESYITLLCKFDPKHVSEFVETVHTSDLKLDTLLQTFDEAGVIDAAVTLMANYGLINNAMRRLDRHLSTLKTSFMELIKAATLTEISLVDFQQSCRELLPNMQNYVHVGIWLCNQQQDLEPLHKTISVGTRRKSLLLDTPLTSTESIWLRLIESTVSITKDLSVALANLISANSDIQGSDYERILSRIRSLVQHVFTALLSATTSVGTPKGKGTPSFDSNAPFLRILRTFLTNAATISPNLADLRSVLSSIFSAYTYEEAILELSSRLLRQNLFINIDESIKLRQRGWRPRTSVCEACGVRLWGPRVTSDVYGAWERRQRKQDRIYQRQADTLMQSLKSCDKGKGIDIDSNIYEYNSDDGWPSPDMTRSKKKASLEHIARIDDPRPDGDDPKGSMEQNSLDDIVLLACRHIYHRKCLDMLQATRAESTSYLTSERQTMTYNEYRCPVHN